MIRKTRNYTISERKNCAEFKYLISLDVSSTKESEATEGTQEENLYDHLEFNCPVKKLEPHYHSSKTLKSLASMDMEIEL